MMHMSDAIKATIGIMDANAADVKIRSSYNVAAMSFTPESLTAEIKKHIPEFTISYLDNDPRQAIADSWPKSIDDSYARKDWAWKNEFDLGGLVVDMISNLR